MDDYSRSYIVIVLATETANVCSALSLLKQGRVEQATDLLEHELDRCIMCIEHLQASALPTESKNLANALEVARAYRSRFPQQAGGG